MWSDPRMSRLLSSVEAQLSTDFALLCLEQESGSGLSSGAYATSAPGVLAMQAGTKYAKLEVRVERWDGQPPPADDEWEDRDVLPWRCVDGPSIACLSGFEVVDGSELSLEGLEQARVEVLAWGRNRYFYSGGPADDDWDQVPPERWLLRLWPDPAGLDAMAGAPRRLIGRSWLPAPTSGFPAAVSALRTTGWVSALGGPFSAIFQALPHQNAAFRLEELPQPFRHWTWETVVSVGRNEIADARLELVARAAGVEIRTYRDALRALVALGVFATVETPSGNLLVPNPAPPVSPWDIVEPVPATGYQSPRALEFEAYRTVSDDLVHLARWAPDGILRTTPERIATRLGLSCAEAIGALAFLAALGHRVEPLPERGSDGSGTISLSAHLD